MNPLPYLFGVRFVDPRPTYVGADYDMAAIEQRHAWMVEAIDSSADKTHDAALSSHAGADYQSALAANTAAREHADKLLELTAAAFPLSSGEDHTTIQKYHTEATDALAHLKTAREEIVVDMAAHFVIHFPSAPSGVFFPPGFFPPGPPVGPAGPSGPLSPIPAPKSPNYLLLGLAAVALLYLVPAAAVLLYKKKAS